MRGCAAAEREGGVIGPFYETEYARDKGERRGANVCWLELGLGLGSVDMLLGWSSESWPIGIGPFF